MLIKDIKYSLANGAFVPWQMGTIAVNACDNMKPLKCFSEPICEMEIINQLIKSGDDHETYVTPEIEIPSNHYKNMFTISCWNCARIQIWHSYRESTSGNADTG